MENPFEIILNELAEIKAELKRLKQPEVPVHLPDSLTRDQAIEHLKNSGYPIELGQFYKLSANGTIPSQRIGKRLILSRKELDSWLDSQKYRRVTPKQKAAQQLADSASKKIERAKL